MSYVVKEHRFYELIVFIWYYFYINGMSHKKKCGWKKRHFEMAEKSDKMFRENKQGKEVDI